MKRGEYVALSLFFAQAAYVFQQALHIPPVLPGLGDAYFNVPLDSLNAALSSTRTLGYPLFHAWMAHYGWGLESYPTFHMMLLIPCVLVLWWGLRTYGLTGLAALAAVSPLLYVVPVEVVMPETPAKALAIASIGFLLWTAGSRRAAAYIGLALTVFLAYQTRPVFLFLVGFLPVAWFFLYTRRWGAPDPAKWLRHAAATAAACALPLFLFSLLRLILVGHFGLVSFGGQNTIGISVEMLSPRTIAAIPVADRPLARVLYRAREAWPTPRYVTERGVATDWRATSEQYANNVNRIARSMQAQFPLAGAAQENIAVDRAMSRLSLNVFRARPDLYGAWLVAAAIEGAQGTVELLLGGLGDARYRWGPHASLAGIALLAALSLAAWPLERRAFGEGSRPHFARAATVVFFVAFLFWGLKLLLVILVEPPLPRYVQAAAFLLPCAVAALCWDRAVVVAAGALRKPHWYGQCLADYPPIPDVVRPLPWRTWLARATARRGILIGAAIAAVAALAATAWLGRDDRLFRALARDPEAARDRLLGARPPLHWRDASRATPLHYAALHGDAALVDHLIAKGADPRAATEEGAAPIHWAALGSGDAKTIQALLASGADIGVPGPMGMAPLHLAALFGNTAVLEALLEAGADPNARTPGHVAPLHLADNAEVAGVLLARGAEVDLRDGSEATPFHWAHTRDLAEFLLAHGADINAHMNWRSAVRQGTALHRAAHQGDADRARWLLSNGADPNAGDINAMSPLFYAIWRNDAAMLELLLDHGADPNQPGHWVEYRRENPTFHYTDIFGKTIGRHRMRDRFARAVPDRAAVRPLDFAAFLGNNALIDRLLARGADPGRHNDSGMSALHWAALGYRDATIQHLRAADGEEILEAPPRTSLNQFRQTLND